jgi:hypothetical protein
MHGRGTHLKHQYLLSEKQYGKGLIELYTVLTVAVRSQPRENVLPSHHAPRF